MRFTHFIPKRLTDNRHYVRWVVLVFAAVGIGGEGGEGGERNPSGNLTAGGKGGGRRVSVHRIIGYGAPARIVIASIVSQTTIQQDCPQSGHLYRGRGRSASMVCHVPKVWNMRVPRRS